MTVFEKIESQQKGREETTVWMVGEQLKDICREDPAYADIVLADLENKEMSIVHAEKKIKAYADNHRKGSSACVPPNVAEKIIREFYGIPERTKPALVLMPAVPKAENKPLALDLSSYF